jgi:hypothetical protein
MGIATYSYNRTTSGGEIVRELVNSTDGQGLHFDGVAGNIDIASPPDLGTKFSFEFIIQQDTNDSYYLIDFDGAGSSRFIIGRYLNNLQIYSSSSWYSFSVAPLDDNEVHHIVVTVDETEAAGWSAAKLYDNGNEVGAATISSAHAIDSATDAGIGSRYSADSNFFNGTIYRARFWNRTLSEAEIKDSYENPSVKFSNQYGSETDLNVMSCANGSTNPYTSFTSASATGFTAVQIGAVASSAGTADEIALVKGKDYRVTFYIANSGQAPKVSFAEDLNIGTPLQEIVGLGTLTSDTHTYDITYTGATTTGVLVFENTAAASYAIANLSITRVGVVADYDLAFANPTQSLTVQDRAGVADGTASASGVTQVTPIEQLNAKAARIGTSQATPADGEVFADAVVVGDGTANQNWVRVHSVAAQIPGVKLFRGSGDSSDASNNNFGMLVTDSGFEVSKFTDGGANITGRVPFLTIDSDGRVLIGTSTEGEATADNLTIADTGHCGITLRSGTGSVGTLFFSDGTSGADEYRGYVQYDHSANFLKWATDGVERMRIDSTGLVKITNATTAQMQIESTGSGHDTKLEFVNTTGTGSESHIYFSDTTAGTGRISYAHNAGGETDVMNFYTAGAKRFVIEASGVCQFKNGLSFDQTNTSATGASATSGVMSHYETGTWTPTVAGATSVGTYSYYARYGYYTRIGNQVTLQFTIWNVTADSAGSGSLIITGLPWPTRNQADTSNVGSVGVDTVTNAGSTHLFLRTAHNASHVEIWKSADGAADDKVAVTDVSSGTTDIYGQITYLI